MRINTNVPALRSAGLLKITEAGIAASTTRLSSGKKINSAKDDAAGLAISNRLRIQVSALELASRNSLEGVSLVQTAEGALNEVHAMLQRMRELAVQGANDTNEALDRHKIQQEIDQLVTEIDLLSDRTNYNGIKILAGEASRLGFAVSGGVNMNNVVSVVHVTDTVPGGTLTYVIDDVGMPAQVRFNATITGVTTADGTISLNGEYINIPAGTSWGEVQEILDEMATTAGATLQVATGNQVILTTELAGSRQHLDFSIDLPGLAGPYSANSQGTDAVININNIMLLEDPLQSSSGIDSFNNAKTVQIDGNRVEVVSSDGQKIIFELQITLQANGNINFNGGTPIDPSAGGTWTVNISGIDIKIEDFGNLILQVGPNTNMEMKVSIGAVNSDALGIKHLNYRNFEGCQYALSVLDKSINQITTTRTKLGAYQNRLEYNITSLDATAINLENARSRIQDTDFAEEMTEYSRLNVLQQANLAILAQANQRPQQILSLIQ